MEVGTIVFFFAIFFFMFLLGGSSGSKKNYRKNGLDNANRDAYGNIYDAYTGKRHKAKNMDADHIWPKSRGGSNADWNMAMTHKSVNRSKGNKIDPTAMAKGYGKNKNVRTSAKAAAAATGIFVAGAAAAKKIAEDS